MESRPPPPRPPSRKVSNITDPPKRLPPRVPPKIRPIKPIVDENKNNNNNNNYDNHKINATSNLMQDDAFPQQIVSISENESSDNKEVDLIVNSEGAIPNSTAGLSDDLEEDEEIIIPEASNPQRIMLDDHKDESTCWCLTFKRKSVFARSLESYHCPRFFVLLYQCLEEIRWIINRILLNRPCSMLQKIQCCTTTCLWLTEHVSYITIGDIVLLGAFILFEIQLMSPAFADMDADSDANFYIFGKQMGVVACWNYGLTWLLGQRNTMWNFLFGVPFERAIHYHRYMGRFATFCIVIHFLGIINQWNVNGGYDEIMKQSKDPLNISGYIALTCSLFIVLFSLEYFRRATFEFFIKTHWILFIIFIWFASKHNEEVVTDLLLYALILWCVDLIWRAYLSFGCNKQVKIISMKLLPSNVIRIEFEKNNFVFEAAQYVFICIPAIDLTQWHPFSISTAPQDNTIMVHIRVLGTWTKKLREFVINQNNNNDYSKVLMFIEGPYGSVSVPLHYYQHVVLISGGIGITPMQSVFNELIHEMRDGRKIKFLHFIWTVRETTMMNEFAQQHWSALPDNYEKYVSFNANNQRLPKFFSPDLFFVHPSRDKSKVNESEILTHFYLTRVDEDKKREYYENYPFVKFGRPDVDKILQQAKEKFLSKGGLSCGTSVYGVAVLACGPPALLEEVKKYSAKHGLACHTEVFDF